MQQPQPQPADPWPVDDFSFAAAALELGPRAEGCQEPDIEAPDTWKAQFKQLLQGDPKASAGLFKSCRAGRDTMLQEYDKMSMIL